MFQPLQIPGNTMDPDDTPSCSSETDQLLLATANAENIGENHGDNVLVLNNGNLDLVHKNSAEIQRPLRSVTDVLREAEYLMTDGPMQAIETHENQQVIVDEVDVEYSPMKPTKSHLPFEIVVRHNKVIEHPGVSDSDEEEEQNWKEQPTARLNTVQEEKETEQPSTAVVPSSSKEPAWKKGHRRAWSMPNAKGEKMTVAVIHDSGTNVEGNRHKRRIVKYKLHSHQPRQDGKTRMAVGTSAAGSPSSSAAVPIVTQRSRECKIRFDPDITSADDDDELQVEINEEEIQLPAEDGIGARTIVKRFWEARWKATNFEALPDWLQDNEYIRTGHRPPIPSFSNCFKSIFALHSETGNIWTHMYGCVAFLGVGIWFLTRPTEQVQWVEKLIYSTFFLGAVICLGMSFAFHTVACHSIEVSKLFSKLDYTGISLLIVGSFIPWIYVAFYCRPQPMIIYITMITVLGILAMVVSLWDKFAEPKFRPLRATVFVAMGLSAIVPAIHLLIVDGICFMLYKAGLGWMLLMGGMYIGGAAIYATRIPERWFPGKCDLWFQSHQLFHTFVVIAAFVHFHAITVMGMGKLMEGSCSEQLYERYGVESHPSWLGTLLGLDEPPGIVSWNPNMRHP